MSSERETLNNITDFGRLREFCADIDCRECEMVLTKDEIDSNIMEIIHNGDWLSWEDVRDYLNGIKITEGDSGYYLENIYYDGPIYTGLNNEDIDDFKEGVVEFIAQKEFEENRSTDIDDDEEIPESGTALEDMLKGDD